MARKKIISAGPLVQAAVYKTARTARGDAQRGRKRNATSDAQRLINARCSWQKLKLLLAANFIRGDIVGCLTCRRRARRWTTASSGLGKS